VSTIKQAWTATYIPEACGILKGHADHEIDCPDHTSLEQDWALLVPEMKPISLINRFLFEGKDLDIAEISTINEDCRPLLLHQKYPEPLTVDCSEAASLIPLPGGDGMTIAHKVYHLAGEFIFNIF
jgi:hypothetical protein